MSYKPRECPQCKASYVPRRHDQIYCSRTCNDAYKNRAFARGQVIYREVYHWALGEDADARSLMGDIKKAAREWIKEDKLNGLAPPPLPDRLKTARLNKSYELRRQAAVVLLAEIAKAKPSS